MKSVCLILMAILTSSLSFAQSDVSSESDESDSIVAPGDKLLLIQHRAVQPYIATNYTQLLDGNLPGMQVVNFSGQPGAESSFLIRGISTVYQTPQSLILVDGFPYYGNANALNPADIESISVLKDVDEMVDHLANAQNGIIDIRTKTGDSSQGMKLTVNAEAGISTPALRNYKTVNERDYYELSWEAYRNYLFHGGGYSYEMAGQIASGLYPSYERGVVEMLGYNSYSVPDDMLIDPVTGKLNASEEQLRYHDNWNDAMRQTGIRQEYHVGLSNSGKLGSFFFSTGYLRETGYMRHTGYQRLPLRFNGTLHYKSWLRAGIHLSGSIDEQQYIPDEYYNSLDPIFVSATMAPVYPVYYYDENGNKVKDPQTGDYMFDWGSLSGFPESSMGNRMNVVADNPAGDMAMNQYLIRGKSWSAIPYVEITFLKQLSLSTDFVRNYDLREDDQKYNATYGPAAPEGRTLQSSWKQHYFNWRQTLSWKKQMKGHDIRLVLAHHSEQADMLFNEHGTIGNFPNDTRKNFGINEQSSWRANAHYNFRERYFLSGGYYRNKNSAYNLSIHTYRTFGAAWRISNEPFMKSLPWLSMLELKGSYGLAGDNMIHPVSSGPLVGVMGNASITPPKTKSTGIGIRSGFFNNRLTFSVDYYHHLTDSAYFYLPVPTAGVSRIAFMGIKNEGVELQLDAVLVNRKNFNWTVNANLSMNHNSITRTPIDSLQLSSYFLLSKGLSLYDFYLVESAGVDPENGDELYFYYKNGKKLTTNEFSEAVMNGRALQGSALPKYYGGVSNYIRYRHIDLSFTFTYRIGGKYYDRVYQELMMSNPGQTFSTDILDRWTPENTGASLPRVEWLNLNLAQPSSRFLRDASCLNLRSVHVGYTLMPEQLKRFYVNSLRFYLAADNLFLWSAYPGMNPQAYIDGVSWFDYASARRIVVGLNLSLF